MLIDFEKHNDEVKTVWEAYHKRQPLRMPIIFGINSRYTMFNPEANPHGLTYKQYSNHPQTMMERQLEHQYWIRHNVPQDLEMGLPKNGWNIHVDFQNYYEAGWLGCKIRYYDDQVPDSTPLLSDEDKKNAIFEAGIPDPFEGNLMRKNWEFYDYFKRKQESGFTWNNKPIANVSPTGLGTDGPVTVACNLRGATEFFTDLLVDTDYAMKLLDFITESIILRIDAYRKQLGIPLKTPGWGYADDSIQLISTQMYKDYILPFHERLIDHFSERGQNSIHLCGDSTRHFQFLRDNLNIYSFDTGYPIDFKWVREQVGPDVQIQGGPSIAFLETSSPDEIKAEVKRILSSGVTEGGRFILREGNNLPPGVGLEKLWSMYEAGKEYGRY